MSKATVFETYRFYDPVIVAQCEPEVAGRYAETRDASVLALPPEAKPVVFRCAVLTRTQRNRVEEIGSDRTRLVQAFRFGLREIRDIPQADGTRTSWVPQRSKDGAALDDKALDALEELGFGDPDLWEVGSVIVARSFLAFGSPVYVPQLASSQLAWVAIRSRSLAAQSTDNETPQAP